jgi:hypothetical protein
VPVGRSTTLEACREHQACPPRAAPRANRAAPLRARTRVHHVCRIPHCPHARALPQPFRSSPLRLEFFHYASLGSTIRNPTARPSQICVIRRPHSTLRKDSSLDLARGSSNPLARGRRPFSATHGSITQEQEPIEWAIRLPDPASDLDISIGKSRVVRRVETRDPQSGGRGLPNDEQPADVPTLPASLLGQSRGQACLAVEPMERRLGVRHDRLDLDHEQTRSRRVPRDYVDRAALPQDREGHLDRDVPACFTE